MIRQGKSNHEIAFDLGLGLGTVKQHVVALFRKLKVSSRAMAVVQGQRQEAFAAGTALSESTETILQRRPCVVLSVTVDDQNPAALKALQKSMFDIANSSGDIFISRKGMGGDLILGIDRILESHPLQALMATGEIYRKLESFVSSQTSIKGALTAGLAMASMYRQGGWSGEALASSTIVLARHRALETDPGTLFLDQTFIQAFRACSGILSLNQSQLVDFKDPKTSLKYFSPWPDASYGREKDIARLFSALEDSARVNNRAVLLWGDSGSGKSSLCHGLSGLLKSRNKAFRLLSCLPPGLSFPFFDVQEAHPCGLKSIIEDLSGGSAEDLVIFDDLHQADEKILSAVQEHLLHKYTVLLVHRDRLNISGKQQFRLSPLTRGSMAKVVADNFASGHVNPDHLQQTSDYIAASAAANPFFAAEMARCREFIDSLFSPERELKPYLPIQIIIRVSAHLDRLNMDSKLLRAVAFRKKGIKLLELAHYLGDDEASVKGSVRRAADNGILITSGNVVRFAHPMFQRVISYLGVDV